MTNHEIIPRIIKYTMRNQRPGNITIDIKRSHTKGKQRQID